MEDKKKCVVCKKTKKIELFASKSKSPRCIECKNKADSKKKPGDKYFGI